MRKVIEAKAKGERSISVWGTGSPRREFLYSDDLAEACVFLLNLPDREYDSLLSREAPPLINIGTGEDLTIRELAELICSVLEFDGDIKFDASKPDGTPRKLLDVSRLKRLGWQAKTPLREGVTMVYREYAGIGSMNLREQFSPQGTD
jgi:GDP-L-fucose synthase